MCLQTLTLQMQVNGTGQIDGPYASETIDPYHLWIRISLQLVGRLACTRSGSLMTHDRTSQDTFPLAQDFLFRMCSA
jgi:hypothetical protein